MARLIPSLLILNLLLSATASHPEQHIITRPFPMAAEEVRKKLNKAEIIPTVTDDFTPSFSLHATWSSHDQASLGNSLKPKDAQDKPTITLHDIHASSSSSSASPSSMPYVITLTDPDAPSRSHPSASEFCHWIASGTLKPQQSPSTCDPKEPGCSTPPMVLSGLKEVIPYMGPAPPAGTGKHRYVFLAFVPSNGSTGELHLSKPGGRKHWGYKVGSEETRGVREWAGENGLSVVAANFVYAEH